MIIKIEKKNDEALPSWSEMFLIKDVYLLNLTKVETDALLLTEMVKFSGWGLPPGGKFENKQMKGVGLVFYFSVAYSLADTGGHTGDKIFIPRKQVVIFLDIEYKSNMIGVSPLFCKLCQMIIYFRDSRKIFLWSGIG